MIAAHHSRNRLVFLCDYSQTCSIQSKFQISVQSKYLVPSFRIEFFIITVNFVDNSCSVFSYYRTYSLTRICYLKLKSSFNFSLLEFNVLELKIWEILLNENLEICGNFKIRPVGEWKCSIWLLRGGTHYSYCSEL